MEFSPLVTLVKTNDPSPLTSPSSEILNSESTFSSLFQTLKQGLSAHTLGLPLLTLYLCTHLFQEGLPH